MAEIGRHYRFLLVLLAFSKFDIHVADYMIREIHKKRDALKKLGGRENG